MGLEETKCRRCGCKTKRSEESINGMVTRLKVKHERNLQMRKGYPKIGESSRAHSKLSSQKKS